MFLRTIYFFVLMLVGMSMAAAQNACNDLYTKAKASHQKGDYADAFAKYRAVKLCNPALSSEVDKRVEQLFADVNNERQKAEKARNEAIAAQQKTAEALQLAENERLKNKRIVDATYFHADKFGLGYRKTGSLGKYGYGYIDKEGRVVIDFQFEKATPFADDGFARVEKGDKRYLLDTLGRMYVLAQSVGEITAETQAVDLTASGLKEFPKEIINSSTIEIALVARNYFITLPQEIGRMERLQCLDLSSNELIDIPELPISLKVLNISGNGLATMPKNISKLVHLEQLDVRSNEISDFPQELTQLTNLSKLDISNNQITNVPNGVSNLKKIKHFNIGYNPLNGDIWLAQIVQLPNIEELILPGCNITKLPANFYNSFGKKLRVLCLGENILKKFAIPSSLPALVELDLSELVVEELDLDFALMPSLRMFFFSSPQGLKNCQWKGTSGVEYVDLSDYPLASLPTMQDFQSLKKISLNDAAITQLPNFGRSALSIEELSLSGATQLTSLQGIDKLVSLKMLRANELPPNIIQNDMDLIFELSSLENLYMSENKLSHISPKIKNLKELRALQLWNNNLVNLPMEMTNLKNLLTIDVSKNKFTIFPSILFELKNIEAINIEDNKIALLQDSFSVSAQLHKLEIAKNLLTELPTSIGNLRRLGYLDCEKNKLTQLPSSITNCGLLYSLYLNNNLLTQLPENIGMLALLNELNISNNPQLQSLPLSMDKLIKLKFLNLAKCPIPEAQIIQLKKALPRCDFD